MIRSARPVALAMTALFVCLCPLSAQEPLQQSPITPGFWVWPRQKTTDPQVIAELCRDKLALQFADGRYLGIKLRIEGKPNVPPEIDEVGRCSFNKATQVERCDLKQFNEDGSTAVGFIESRYSYDADRTLKMSVKVTVTEGDPKDPAAFDVYPVPCSSEVVWDSLHKFDPK